MTATLLLSPSIVPGTVIVIEIGSRFSQLWANRHAGGVGTRTYPPGRAVCRHQRGREPRRLRPAVPFRSATMMPIRCA